MDLAVKNCLYILNMQLTGIDGYILAIFSEYQTDRFSGFLTDCIKSGTHPVDYY